MSPARSRATVAVVVAASAVATCLFLAVPSLRFAYEAPTVRVVLETSAALVALISAYLVLGRFLRARHFDSLLLATGLAVLACANLAATALLALPPSESESIAFNAASAIGAILLACAAFAPRRPVTVGRRQVLGLLAATALVILVSAAVLLVLDTILDPAGVAEVVRNPKSPQLETDVALLFAQSVAVAAFLAAAFGFARRAWSEEDGFYLFVAAGSTLAAFAKINYVLFAPTQGGLVRTGDVFRALFYLVLLVGAAREIELYWERLAQTAVLEERRRIARDLHDGVAQELAFIGRRAKRLAAAGGNDIAREIHASAERALGDSRRAIAALTRPLDQPLDEVIAEAAGEIAARYDVALELALEPDVKVGADTREALVRIACEAVSNAARHGNARVVRLQLSNGNGVHFGVADDGTGFDPEAPTPARFGIAIMRERAQAAGGSFRLRSAPGLGTKVEVEFP